MEREGSLTIVRHGESEWNALGKWTGLIDVNLSENGKEQARTAGKTIKKTGIIYDAAYTSNLKRAKQTWDEIKKEIGQEDVPTIAADALNERDYGKLTGRKKWEVKEEVGEEDFTKIRRSWDFPPPGGESLKMVYERVVPYYEENILPKLEEGQHLIIVAHGNSNRALIKKLDNISDDDISRMELSLGTPIIYKFDEHGNVLSKEERHIGTTAM